jgi:hypothetical protein
MQELSSLMDHGLVASDRKRRNECHIRTRNRADNARGVAQLALESRQSDHRFQENNMVS